MKRSFIAVARLDYVHVPWTSCQKTPRCSPAFHDLGVA